MSRMLLVTVLLAIAAPVMAQDAAPVTAPPVMAQDVAPTVVFNDAPAADALHFWARGIPLLVHTRRSLPRSPGHNRPGRRRPRRSTGSADDLRAHRPGPQLQAR